MLLGKARIHAEQYDIVTNGKLYNLIIQGLVANKMATSLMNDSNNAYHISKNLIEMSEVLFLKEESGNREFRDELLITEEDVEEFITSEKE